ncbi:lysylphosphatidylglycerol synthase domain-containing protein [Ferrovibrio terrae]|uniref:lysylphosphatidylglycerol synthase domain-containing protein n=1 Tax=Ferrovibrio terrae TaxID=2594003 RepID=UPI003137D35F
MTRILRNVLFAITSLGALLATFYLVDPEAVALSLRSIHWHGILIATLLVLANNYFSLLRFRSVLRTFGFRPSWHSLFFSHSVGQVSNQILFNVIGQSLSRAAVLASNGVPYSISILATYLERAQAAAILLLLSLGGLCYLFINVHFDFLPATQYMASMAAALFITVLVVALTALRSARLLQNLPGQMRGVLRLWPSLLLTLAAHGCMLAAYLSLLWGLGISPFDSRVMAALFIVMFTASLPISFSGWGIREFSAAQALGVIGISESVAVASAVAVGLIGLLVMLLTLVCSGMLLLHWRIPARGPPPSIAPMHLNWSGAALAASATLCAILLFFQVRIPLQDVELTGNLADIIALTGLGLAPIALWIHRNALPAPSVLIAGLLAISVLLIFSLLHGYTSFGWTRWAFVNRGLGWLIILGYAATGLSIALSGKAQYRNTVLGTFVATGTTLAVLQIALLIASLFGVSIPRDVFALPLQAYAGNPNAFAVQMSITTAAAVAAQHLGLFDRWKYMLPSILSVLSLAIYYSHSRAGIGMLGIVLACMLIFPGHLPRRQLISAILLPPLTIAVFSFLYDQIYGYMLTENSFVTLMLAVDMTRDSGDLERWRSIIDGWQMWLQHPVFGKGLGAYIEQHLNITGRALIIHSVPVWLLAETGLLGFGVVAVFFLALLRHAHTGLSQPNSGWSLGLLILLLSFAAGNLVHDFFFQRNFWFLLGLLIAIPAVAAAPGNTLPSKVI